MQKNNDNTIPKVIQQPHQQHCHPSSRIYFFTYYSSLYHHSSPIFTVKSLSIFSNPNLPIYFLNFQPFSRPFNSSYSIQHICNHSFRIHSLFAESEAFTRCRVNRSKTNRLSCFEYVDLDTGCVITPEEYEKRYMTHLAVIRGQQEAMKLEILLKKQQNERQEQLQLLQLQQQQSSSGSGGLLTDTHNTIILTKNGNQIQDVLEKHTLKIISGSGDTAPLSASPSSNAPSHSHPQYTFPLSPPLTLSYRTPLTLLYPHPRTHYFTLTP